jgi:glycosyltransferase involved in cell wall biosynthesis
VKFLIHSNAPTIPTGYGVQTRYLADRLAAAGHEVAISCTYGHQGPIGTWTSPSGHSIRLYPSGYITNSPDVICAHAEHWFEGDPKAGWIIPVIDVWCLANHPDLQKYQVAAWAPVDHQPCPPDVLRFFHNTGALPIAMSEFGGEMFRIAGLDPYVIPLAVDTKVYKPTFELEVADRKVTARELFRLPNDAFVVGMVGMNKGWAKDRKGFNEALRAFGLFHREHPNAVLFMHTDQSGAAEGINLLKLAAHAAVPPHSIVWSDQYAYRLGLPPNMMAAAYTAMDVLLAPSHGEGFCVPLVEAQACGTPVIASDFSAQTELVGAGWKVAGQLDWDPSQDSSYIVPFIVDIYNKLNEAYAADLEAMQADAIAFAANYDVDHLFDTKWAPLLASMEPAAPIERPAMKRVDVLVPAIRESNRKRLHDSFLATAPKTAKLILGEEGAPLRSYAENVNALLAKSDADFVLIVGDDVEFTPGWFEAAQAVSTTADVIGTNDSEPGRIRNADVAAGRHADHFFIRRSYIDDVGASLDGPGIAMPTAYRHWFTDKEVIELAKARGVYVHADECRIIHHHPGYEPGGEEARQADPTYMKAVESSEKDQRTFLARAPMIEAHRAVRR